MIKDRQQIAVSGIMIKSTDHETVQKGLLQIEQLIEDARAEAIGWMYAYACICSNEGRDIRKIEAPSILEKFKKDLE
jgi:hypothetical protein